MVVSRQGVHRSGTSDHQKPAFSLSQHILQSYFQLGVFIPST